MDLEEKVADSEEEEEREEEKGREEERRRRRRRRRDPSALDCTARTRRTGDGVGAREFRLKRSCFEKHVSLRRCRCGSGPRGNVVVECRSELKHKPHISHFLCSNSQCLG